MYIFQRVALALLVSLLVGVPGRADDAVVFDFDDVEVTEQDLVEYLTERLLPEAYEKALTRPGAVSQAVGNIFIVRRAARAAREMGLVQSSSEAWEAQDAVDRYAVEQLVARETDLRMSSTDWDALAKEQYIATLEQQGAARTVAVSHILIRSAERDFNEIVSRVAAVESMLAEGRAFEDVAREMSEDSSAELNGGSLGYISRGQTDPLFETVAFAMTDIGAVSAPTLSSFGVHFIRLDGERQSEAPQFEERRPFLIKALKKQASANVRPSLLEPFRGPAMPALQSLDEESLAARLLRLLSDN